MAKDNPELLADVARYYAARLALHGATPRGVDWNGAESQQLRFLQLGRVITPTAGVSVNDLGCGYGALLDFLLPTLPDLRYHGYDVAADMIDAARQRHAAHSQASFYVASAPVEVADYSIASGIFNVRLQHTDDAWRDYLEATLQILDTSSVKGFAFNCLTRYADADRMRDDLYYADPCQLFDLCQRRFSRHVALLHDYGLYEFTLLVRKTL